MGDPFFGAPASFAGDVTPSESEVARLLGAPTPRERSERTQRLDGNIHL